MRHGTRPILFTDDEAAGSRMPELQTDKCGRVAPFIDMVGLAFGLASIEPVLPSEKALFSAVTSRPSCSVPFCVILNLSARMSSLIMAR